MCNAPYVEEMYENYLSNPGSVPDNWREYFDALQHVPAVDGSNSRDVPHQPVINAFAERAKQGVTQVVVASPDAEMGRKRTAVQQLIAAYRNVGARWADLDPLKRVERPYIPELDPVFYEFSDADQEAVFNTSNTFFGKQTMSLRELLKRAARDLLRCHRCRVHVHHRPEPETLVAGKAGNQPHQPEFHRREEKNTSSTV